MTDHDQHSKERPCDDTDDTCKSTERESYVSSGSATTCLTSTAETAYDEVSTFSTLDNSIVSSFEKKSLKPNISLQPDNIFHNECDKLPQHNFLCNWKLHFIIKWLCNVPFSSTCTDREQLNVNKRKADEPVVLVSDTDSDSEKSFSLIRSKERNRFLKKIGKN